MDENSLILTGKPDQWIGQAEHGLAKEDVDKKEQQKDWLLLEIEAVACKQPNTWGRNQTDRNEPLKARICKPWD
jgi:hypothetical protein